jgi:dienelactone hydrolase
MKMSFDSKEPLPVLLAALLLIAASSPVFAGVEKVLIKWDGTYPHNSDTVYDARKSMIDSASITNGYSRNFNNGHPSEWGKVKRDGILEGYQYHPEKLVGQTIPYVVFMHGCRGHTVNWVADIALDLNKLGIGFLSLDSFATRAMKPTCGEPDAHWARRRASDAYSALDYLTDNKFADNDRVYLMGHSNGGQASLVAMETRFLERKYRFAASIALEGNCHTLWARRSAFYGPIFMILAEKDEANPPIHCRNLAKGKHAHPIQTLVIKGAHHGYLFDGKLHDERGAQIAKEAILTFFKNPSVMRKTEYK